MFSTFIIHTDINNGNKKNGKHFKKLSNFALLFKSNGNYAYFSQCVCTFRFTNFQCRIKDI